MVEITEQENKESNSVSKNKVTTSLYLAISIIVLQIIISVVFQSFLSFLVFGNILGGFTYLATIPGIIATLIVGLYCSKDLKLDKKIPIYTTLFYILFFGFILSIFSENPILNLNYFPFVDFYYLPPFLLSLLIIGIITGVILYFIADFTHKREGN